MDTSEPSSTRQEEEEEQSGREGAEMEEDIPESLDECSQELFSSQEEGSQLWQPVLGEGQTSEEVPDATLRHQPSMLSPAERFQRIRKRPHRSKEHMLHKVMQYSSNENLKVQEWQDSERRIHRQNEEYRHKCAVLWQQSMDRLISIMEHQAELIQALVAMQVEHYRAQPPLQPLSQNSFPCAPMSPPTHFPQHPGSYHHQLPPTPVASPPRLKTVTLTLCTQPPSPCSVAILKCSTHCTALQTGRLSMVTGHMQICDCTIPHPSCLPFLFLKQLFLFNK
ncbi:uncharacterized protein LOC122459080 [Dermochelys coriacea]|uniref:uncharacterized protein LOC122459080 n=1 Tax=Dermochelys coriacea TaxID=27794 RepID=UPI001CA9C812|nr:uncharacterized protein LOC122459080 [Dermochelys coriacea]